MRIHIDWLTNPSPYSPSDGTGVFVADVADGLQGMCNRNTLRMRQSEFRDRCGRGFWMTSLNEGRIGWRVRKQTFMYNRNFFWKTISCALTDFFVRQSEPRKTPWRTQRYVKAYRPVRQGDKKTLKEFKPTHQRLFQKPLDVFTKTFVKLVHKHFRNI